MQKLIVLAASRLLPGRSPKKITRRFAVATLLVLAVAVAALLAGPSVLAKPAYGHISTYSVKLAPTGIEPDAAGVAKVSLAFFLPGPIASGTVTCKGLTPNANYVVRIIGGTSVASVPFTTDARGAGTITYGVGSSFVPTFLVYGGPSGQLVLD